MMSKIIKFFEAYIEKVVLAVVVLVCIWLLITGVLLSPNKVAYNGEKLSPGKIDMAISKEAEVLRHKLNNPAQAPAPYDPCLPHFAALLESAIGNIDVNLYPPMPSIGSLEVGFAREYNLPFIGEVNEVAVEHIRAVAFVPTSIVDEQNAYKEENSEPNDIDLVTVEGKFEIGGLYTRFQECFVGSAVTKEEWYDPCLARPVFAAVQLQRQKLDGDGTWSDWEDVSRTRIDPYKKLFEVIEDVQDLPPGGLTVRMLRFDNPQAQINLLQPEGYMIASTDEEWFPPTLHNKYLEQRRQEEIEARREAQEKAREEREKEREEKLDERRSARSDTGARTGRPGGGHGGYGTESASSRSGSRSGTRRSRTSRERPVRREMRDERRGTRSEEELSTTGRSDVSRGPSSRLRSGQTTSNVYDEFYAIMIPAGTDLAQMHEPLVFWAHDDTVEAWNSYRYRIRLGVFNPIAGTNQFSEQDKSSKNDVILWSGFSDVTEQVVIPARSYFFASNIQEAAKTVTVDVCKYALGYWYSETFAVKRGEVIGKVKRVELKPEEQQSGIAVPDIIDYGTGAILVDVVPVNDWSGGQRLIARQFYDMLYSYDGINIEHMPVKVMNWSRGLQAIFSDIQKSIKQKKQPLRDWGRKFGRMRRAPEMGSYESGSGEFLYGERR